MEDRNELPVLTYSSSSRYQNCPREYYHRYIMHLKSKIKREPLFIGSLFHLGLEHGLEKAVEEIRKAQPLDQKEADRLMVIEAIIVGALKGYASVFASEPEGTEREPEFLLSLVNPDTGRNSRKFRLGGKADWLYQLNGSWVLGEAKTRGAQIGAADISKLDLDQQVLNAVAGLQRARGITIGKVEYRYILKPMIRQRKDETIDQYCERIVTDYQERPDFYFHQETIYVDQARVTEWERDLWRIAQQINWSLKHDWWFRNTSRCAEWSGCGYLPLCRGEDVEGLYEVSEPNPELQEVANVGITR